MKILIAVKFSWKHELPSFWVNTLLLFIYLLWMEFPVRDLFCFTDYSHKFLIFINKFRCSFSWNIFICYMLVFLSSTISNFFQSLSEILLSNFSWDLLVRDAAVYKVFKKKWRSWSSSQILCWCTQVPKLHLPCLCSLCNDGLLSRQGCKGD